MQKTIENELPPQSAEEKRIRTFIDIQLGKQGKNLSWQQKKAIIQKKFTKVLIMMGLNVGFVLFFAISFYYDITQLSTSWFNVIIVFFLINVLFSIYQHRQLKEATTWIEKKQNET